MKKLAKRILSGKGSELSMGSFWAFLIRGGGMGITFLFTLLVTQSLGSEAYGVFMLSQSTLMILAMLARAGMDRYLLRSVSASGSNDGPSALPYVFKRVLLIVLPLSLLLGTALWAIAPFLSRHLMDTGIGELCLRWVALAIPPMTLLFMTSEGLRGLKLIKQATLLRMVVPFAVGIVIVLLFRVREDALLPVAAYVLGILVASLLGILMWGKRMGWKGHRPLAGNENYDLGTMARRGFPLLLGSSMLFLMNWLDVLMLGAFRTDQEVGVYSAAMRVANLQNIALFAVNAIAAPKFSEKYASGDMEALGRTVRWATRTTFFLVLPLFLIIVTLPRPILSLFGEGFDGGVGILILLVIGKVVNAGSGSVIYFLQMTGREGVARNILTTATLANLVLNLGLIPIWGAYGAAWASMLSIAGWNIAGAIYIRRRFGILTVYWPFGIGR